MSSGLPPLAWTQPAVGKGAGSEVCGPCEDTEALEAEGDPGEAGQMGSDFRSASLIGGGVSGSGWDLEGPRKTCSQAGTPSS